MPVTTEAVTPRMFNAFICSTTLFIVGSELAKYVPAVIPNSFNAVPDIIICVLELDITKLEPDIVAVILDNVLSSVARLSSLYSFTEPVVLNPKSFKKEPAITKDGSEVVIVIISDDSDADTGTAEELMISAILLAVLPDAISTWVPLIINYSAEDVVPVYAVPVTLTLATDFDTLSTTTVFPVVKGEVLVAVDVVVTLCVPA